MKDEEVGGNEGLGGNEGVDREQEGGQGDDVRRSEGEKARPAPEFAEMRTASLQPDKHLEQKERVMKAPAAGDAVTAFVKQVAAMLASAVPWLIT